MTTQQALQIALQQHRTGNLRAADALYRQILAGDPNQPDALHLLGVLAGQTGNYPAAIELIGKSIRVNPASAGGYESLGLVLSWEGKIGQAIGAYQQSLDLDPQQASVLNNLANAFKDAGQIDRAVDRCRKALAIDPGNALIHSNLCYTLHFHPDYSPERIFAEMQQWDRRHAQPLRTSLSRYENEPAPERRLRIAYLSPDFYAHAESFFVLPLLRGHDRGNFEVHGYASVRRGDRVTQWMKSHTDSWHEVLNISDGQLAEQIRADGIDILVDLTMHMAFNRMLVLARKPAPVQVVWLAYPGGTGLQTVDYRLTDRYMDPPGQGNENYTETSVRLPDGWFCYDPLGEVPPAAPRPGRAITFGSLNNPGKLSEPTLRLWAAVLAAVPGARLLLLANDAIQPQILQLLSQAKIDPQRVEFVAHCPRGEYLRFYDRIDIALDPLPYNGITTTCDALWMGVPVISILGATPAGRAGLSILSNLGLADLVADRPQQYVALAAALAGDPTRLDHLRSTLRGKMQASPLMDAKRFARNLEAAYRDMWRKWCGTAVPVSLKNNDSKP